MFGLADMYLKSMTDETRHQTGDWHCKITAIDEKTSEYIAARPEIDLSGWQGNIPAEIGCTVADQPVSVAGMDETIFSEIYLGSVLSGEFPEIAGQVAVSSTLAQTAGISVGDTLTLNSPDGSTMQLTITGIMDDDAANMISGSASAILLTPEAVSYTHLRAHETRHDLVCRLLLEKKYYTHLRAHETGRNLVCRLLLEKKKTKESHL